MKKTDSRTKTRASRSAAPHCSACRWWRRDAKTKDVGICHDAIKRARMVVPFAVNLSESMIFAWGGKDCPCFEPNSIVLTPGKKKEMKMNERPTPETAMMLLESERDELREVYDLDTQTLRAERDEARDALRKARIEAETLATSIHKAEYAHKAPEWSLCDTVAGVVAQIDNMYAGVRMQRDDARERHTQTIIEKDRWQAMAEQKWGLRREVESLLGVESGECSDAQFAKGVDQLRKVIAENAALRDALRVRRDRACGACGAAMLSGCDHVESCRHYATEREVMQ